MSAEDASPLAAVVRLAIVDLAAVFVGRCVSDCASRAQTRAEWMRVVIDCDREATRESATNRYIARAVAVAARLMAEGDAETAARELAAVRGQTVAAWREELTNDRNTAAREP